MRYPRLFWGTVLASALASRFLVLRLLPLLAPRGATPEEIGKAVLPHLIDSCVPEPREQMAYVLAVLLPVALVLGAVLLLNHLGAFRVAESPSLWLGGAAVSAQVILVGFAGRAWLYESEHSWSGQLNNIARAQLVIGACAACYLGVRWLQPTRRRLLVQSAQWVSRVPWLAWLIATGWTVAHLLCCIFTDDNIEAASGTISYHLPFTIGEFAAVVNGRVPLVDFQSQYENLLGHLLRPFFAVAGVSVTTFTLAMSTLSLVGFLMLYQVLSRVAASPWLGLLLYLPCVPISLADDATTKNNPSNAFSYYAIGPIRYFGVFLMAYLTLHYLTKPRFKRLTMVSFIAGLVVLNNLDFGIGAAAGLLVCVTMFPPSSSAPGRLRKSLLASAVFGGSAALAFVAFAVIARVACGVWPNFALLTEYQRTFAVLGFNMLPLPRVGFYWVLYLTFMVALLYAIFDGFSGDGCSSHRLSTGMLAYGGVSGLGVLTYYVGRSHPAVLIATYGGWAYVVALLLHRLLVDVRQTKFADQRAGYAIGAIPVAAALALSCGLLPLVLVLPDVPAQFARLRSKGVRDNSGPVLAEFVSRYVKRNASTVIIWTNPHLIALSASVQNMYPYAHVGSVLLKAQVRPVLESVERLPKDAQYVFGELSPTVSEGLVRMGFTPVDAIGPFGCWRGPSTPAGVAAAGP